MSKLLYPTNFFLMVKNQMWFCVYLLITVVSVKYANNKNNLGFRNVQCDASEYEKPGLIVNFR